MWYLIIAVLIIGTGLMLVAFTYPEYYAKLGKSLLRRAKHASGRPVLTPEQEEAKAKAKKLAPHMALVGRIEKLTLGQVLRFKVPEGWGGNFITVELNMSPQEGNKYILSIENAINGKPCGKRNTLYVCDQPIKIATSIIDREGELFGIAETTPATTEKVSADAK